MRRKEKERPGGVRDLNGASDAKLNTDHLAFTTLSECSKRIMEKVIVLLCCVCVAVAAAAARPATKDLLDKVTANDVAANSVSPAADQKGAAATNTNTKKESSIQILGASVGVEPDLKYPDSRTPSMFAKLIDDIFQIPITVLQSVARLIGNPFAQHAKVTPVKA